MREILFRGKRKDNGECVEGYYFYAPLEQNKLPAIENYIAKHWIITSDNLVYEVIPETVGQYTGLTDKNGKKIFEGDVFAWNDNEINETTGKPYPDEIFVVCFDDKKSAFVSKSLNGACEDLYLTTSDKNSRYIGNTTDNPELLKGGVDNGSM